MDDLNERRIVLLGKTGSGKSSLGNIILGDSLLKVAVSPESETSKCQTESTTAYGIHTTVIDTPGIFDTKMSEEDLKVEVAKSIKECAPGPHAFLIVLKVERYSLQEIDVINKILKYFSEEALNHAVIVFTYGNELNVEMKIEDFVCKSQALSDLVKKCGGRCHVFDNTSWNDNNPDDYRNNQYQVKQLLNTVDEMKNSRGCYTNEMLQAVSKNQWDIETILKIFASVTAGILLGVFFGAISLPFNAFLNSVTGGIAGGAVGFTVGRNASTVLEALKKTIETFIKEKEAMLVKV